MTLSFLSQLYYLRRECLSPLINALGHSVRYSELLPLGQQRVRARAILWNFCPSSPATVKKHHGQLSPAERLNNKRYADNWLENLLAHASMNGTLGYQQNPL